LIDRIKHRQFTKKVTEQKKDEENRDGGYNGPWPEL